MSTFSGFYKGVTEEATELISLRNMLTLRVSGLSYMFSIPWDIVYVFRTAAIEAIAITQNRLVNRKQ